MKKFLYKIIHRNLIIKKRFWNQEILSKNFFFAVLIPSPSDLDLPPSLLLIFNGISSFNGTFVRDD